MGQSVRDKVLDKLLEAEDYLSGEQLSEAFGVSRTSIWKAIKKLKEEGFQIDSVNNRGYLLVENPSDLASSLLVHDLKALGYDHVKWYESIDSTNLEAKRLADSTFGPGETGVFVADEQTLGRGRRGRSWESIKGQGAYTSLLIRPGIPPSSAAMLTLLAGFAVCRTLRDDYGLDAKIKWPNDIVVDGKKICGILTEMSSEIRSLHYVVIGVGINVGQREFDHELQDKATSLAMEKPGMKINKHDLILGWVKAFTKLVPEFEASKSLSFIRKDYEALCVNIGTGVTVIESKGTYNGFGVGISDLGDLMVRCDDGSVKEVMSGEVSVRGIYGYV